MPREAWWGSAMVASIISDESTVSASSSSTRVVDARWKARLRAPPMFHARSCSMRTLRSGAARPAALAAQPVVSQRAVEVVSQTTAPEAFTRLSDDGNVRRPEQV